MQFKIHRLCRNQQTINKLKREEKIYNLPKGHYVTGIDLYNFINDIIHNCTDDYALICHDDVILPTNISENVTKCIEENNLFWGAENWGAVGNAGVEVFTKKVLLHLSDPNLKMITPRTTSPQLVESIDGNTMLLNLKNIRREKVSLPKSLNGYHLYDYILSLELYKKGLLSTVSSLLYITHLSGGSRLSFSEIANSKSYQEYFSSNFSNKKLTTINGGITISQSSGGLPKIEKIIEKTVLEHFEDKIFHLHFFINLEEERKDLSSLLDSIVSLRENSPKHIKFHTNIGIPEDGKENREYLDNSIEPKFNKIDIKYALLKNKKGVLYDFIKETKFPKDSYFFLLNEDSVLLPGFGKYLGYILSKSRVIVGDTLLANHEQSNPKDEAEISSSDISFLYSGKTNLPIHSVIFEVDLVKQILKPKLNISQDFENYFLLLLASKYENIYSFPKPFLRINKKLDTDSSDFYYRYSTSLSQLVNEDIVNINFFNFCEAKNQEFQYIMDSCYRNSSAFKESVVGKLLRLLKKIRDSIF